MAKNYGDVPKWHLGAPFDGKAWIFVDEIQIKRWKNFKRHVAAIEKNCESIDLNCRRRQRQAILQWAYNPFI